MNEEYQDAKLVPINFDWVTIPAGDFLMGSNASDDSSAYGNEMPQHVVHLSAYRIARVPVTNSQYRQFIDNVNYKSPRGWTKKQFPDGKELHPVVNISWHDAQAFCEWAGVRLLTEAEWEKAASWDAVRQIKRIYPWGNEFHEKFCNSYKSGYGDTTEVGTFLNGASSYGVLDMVGNVWEWTNTEYRDYPYDTNDGREVLNSDNFGRVLRGGSWDNVDYELRCANRTSYLPYYHIDNTSVADFGFRVAISSPER